MRRLPLIFFRRECHDEQADSHTAATAAAASSSPTAPAWRGARSLRSDAQHDATAAPSSPFSQIAFERGIDEQPEKNSPTSSTDYA